MRKIIYFPLLFAFYFFAFRSYEVVLFCRAPSLSVEAEPTTILKSHSTRVVYPLHLATGEEVIVKQIKDGSFWKRVSAFYKLAHEYAVLHAIQDLPCVPRLIGKIGNSAFCMEYIRASGKTDFNLIETCVIKEQLLEAFQVLHDRGIYHRDIGYGGNNIILVEGLSPYLIDFGSAITLDPIFNTLIGHFFGRKDAARLLGWAFRMQPESLTSGELETLFLYKTKLSRAKHRDVILEKLKDYQKVIEGQKPSLSSSRRPQENG